MVNKIRKKVRKNQFIKSIYERINKKLVPYLVKKHPIMASKYVYYKITGKRLNLNKPRDFNEKLQWLKIYWQHPLVVKCTDKYEVRQYVEECGCKEIINEIYGVYDLPEDIEWNKLPNKFVVKGTHGCQFNIICDNKDELNKSQVIKTLNEWLSTDYSLETAELHYSKIKPRIICERYLETDAGLLPNDYKIYCFNGKAKIILVATERSVDLKLDFLDLDWNRVDIAIDKYNKGNLPSKPTSLDDMIKYAEILSRPFPFVRVDFYEYKGKPILGELTFTPAGCQAVYYNDKGLKLLGDMLILPPPHTSSDR